jgi:hypothetical protein
VDDGDDTIDGYQLSGQDTQIDLITDKDTVDYSGITNSTYHLVANLMVSTGTNTLSKWTTILSTQTLYNIENIKGTSGNDTITGNSEDNTL